MRPSLPFLIAIVSCLPAAAAKPDVSTLPPAEVKKGTAVISDGPDFLFGIESDSRPVLYIDSAPPAP